MCSMISAKTVWHLTRGNFTHWKSFGDEKKKHISIETTRVFWENNVFLPEILICEKMGQNQNAETQMKSHGIFKERKL